MGVFVEFLQNVQAVIFLMKLTISKLRQHFCKILRKIDRFFAMVIPKF